MPARVDAADPRGKTSEPLNDDRRVSLLTFGYFLEHDLDEVASTTVIVPYFAAGNRISDNEIGTLLFRARNDVGQFDYEDKAIHGAI